MYINLCTSLTLRNSSIDYLNYEYLFQPADKRKYMYGGLSSGRPVTPPRGSGKQGKNKK